MYPFNRKALNKFVATATMKAHSRGLQSIFSLLVKLFFNNVSVSSFFVYDIACEYSHSYRLMTLVSSCHRLVLVMKKKGR